MAKPLVTMQSKCRCMQALTNWTADTPIFIYSILQKLLMLVWMSPFTGLIPTCFKILKSRMASRERTNAIECYYFKFKLWSGVCHRLKSWYCCVGFANLPQKLTADKVWMEVGTKIYPRNIAVNDFIELISEIIVKNFTLSLCCDRNRFYQPIYWTYQEVSLVHRGKDLYSKFSSANASDFDDAE